MSTINLAYSFLDSAILARFAHLRVVSPNFLALHAFYQDVYEFAEGFFDRFAERARAKGLDFPPFSFSDASVRGDCMKDILEDLIELRDAIESARNNTQLDHTDTAMCDEAMEQVEKFIWQLKAMKP